MLFLLSLFVFSSLVIPSDKEMLPLIKKNNTQATFTSFLSNDTWTNILTFFPPSSSLTNKYIRLIECNDTLALAVAQAFCTSILITPFERMEKVIPIFFRTCRSHTTQKKIATALMQLISHKKITELVIPQKFSDEMLSTLPCTPFSNYLPPAQHAIPIPPIDIPVTPAQAAALMYLLTKMHFSSELHDTKFYELNPEIINALPEPTHTIMIQRHTRTISVNHYAQIFALSVGTTGCCIPTTLITAFFCLLFL